MNQVKQTDIKLLNTLEGHSSAINSLCFNSSAQIFSLSKDNNIRSWEIISGKLLKNFINPDEKIKSIRYISKFNVIFFIGIDKNISILDANTLDRISQIDFELEPIIPYCFDSTNNNLLAVAFSDNKIRIYKEDYKIFSTLSSDSKAEITNIAFSPNYKYLCASYSDNTLKVWNISITDPIRKLNWHEGYITSIAFSPDGKYIFSSSYDRTIKVWDFSSGENVYTLKGHSGYVNSISVSPDGKYLISASHDLSIKIWSLESFREIESIKAHISPVLCVTFHSDSSHFASSSSDKTINIWKLNEIVKKTVTQTEIIDKTSVETPIINTEIKNISSDFLGTKTLDLREIVNNSTDFKNEVNPIADSKGNTEVNSHIIQDYKANDIYSFLSFNPNNIFSSADVISPQTKRKIEDSISKLSLLTKNLEKSDIKSPDQIPETYRLFWKSINDLNNSFDSISKVRRLAWAISYSERGSKSIIETDKFSSALKIIDKFWTYTMFHGLFDTYLKIWNKDNNPNINLLRQFLSLKLANYKNKLSNILKIKENERFFFDNNGANYLASNFYTLGKDLSKTLELLNLPSHMISYNYFSDFIAFYTKEVLNSSILINNIPKIIAFLEKNNDKIAIKKCLSKLILKVSIMNNYDLQEEIKIQAFKLIGDPSIDSLWLPWEYANSQEISDLRDAQSILNNWITKQFIELFFSNLTMDVARKNFWEKYLKNIKKFKIFGTQYQYKMMKNDKRIEPYLSTRFGFLTGGGDSINAFIMYIKDYILIEFSSTGNAFYGYKISNPYCPDTEKRELSVGSLKRKEYADIRITHNGDWQYTTSRELRNKLGI